MKIIKRFKKYWRKTPSKWGPNIWTRGPFQFYMGREATFLDIQLTRYENQSWGWEWGSDGNYYPCDIELNVLGLRVFAFRWSSWEIWLLGFWRMDQ